MSNTIKRTINLVLFSVLLFCISGFINTNAAKSKLQPPKVPITKTTKTVKTKSYNVNTNQNAISENDMKAYKKYLNKGIEEILNKKVLLILYTKGKKELKNYDFQKAIENFDKAITINPNGAEALAYRADLYRIMEDDTKSMEYAQKAITINPMDAYANFVMGSLYCSTDTENAKNYLTRAIRYDSKLERAYLNRGQLYYKESSFREAINDFSKVIKINPQNYYAYEGRALSYISLKQFNQALTDLNFLVKKQPKIMRYLMLRAMCHSLLNNVPQSLADINKVIDSEPNNADAYLTRLTIYGIIKADKNLIEADISKILNIAGKDEDKLLRLLDECSNLGRNDDVIKISNKILSINPNNADAYYKIAKTLLKQKKYQQAFDYLTKYKEKTASLDPEFDYFVGFAKLGIAKRNNKVLIKEAIVDLTNSINKNIKGEYAYLYRGSAKVIIGEYVDGYNDLKKYTTLVTVPNKLAYHQMGFAETMYKLNNIKYNKNGYAENVNVKHLGPCDEYEILLQNNNDTSAKINSIVYSPNENTVQSAITMVSNNSTNIAYLKTFQIKFSPTDVETGVITSPYINALGDTPTDNSLNEQSKNILLAELIKEKIYIKLLHSTNKLDVSYYDIDEFFEAINKDVPKNDAIYILCNLVSDILSKGVKIDGLEFKEYPKNLFEKTIEYLENKNCAYNSTSTKFIMRKSNEFLGCIELDENDIANVKNYFNEAIKFGAPKKDLYNIISYWYLEKGDAEYNIGNIDSAIYHYNQATLYGYSKFEVYKHIGDIYFDEKKWFDATSYYTRALNIKKNADVYFRRAYAYSEMNDNSSAIADYTKCIGLNRNYANAYWNRASIYFNRRKWTLAYNDYSKYSSLNKNEPSAVYNMAVCMLNQGNKKAAYPLFARAKSMYQRDRNSDGYNSCVTHMNRINGY